MKQSIVFSLTAFVILTQSMVQAALLVYEPFDGYSGTSLVGQTPNANTIGLNSSVAYAKTSGIGAEQLVTGLTFSNLLTSGGAEWLASGSPVGTAVYLAAQLNHAPSFTGTLYGSYLVKMGLFSDSTYGFAGLTVGDTALGSENRRFYIEADSRDASNAPGIRYQFGNEAVGSTALALNTTYLVISKFTNVGTALSAGNPGVATLWTLTPNQFNSFNAAGSLESWLDTPGNVLNRTTVTETSGTYGFDSSDFLRMVCYTNSGVEHATFDEIRFGTQLGDVVPVPEPGTLLLALMPLLAWFFFRHKKNHSPCRIR